MKRKYRNVSFLAELLINILVFSISCAVLVGLFGKASELARATREESYASAELGILIEQTKAQGVLALGGEMQADGSLLFHYDADWNRAEAPEARYAIRLAVEEAITSAGSLLTITGEASAADGRALCEVATKAYRPAA